MVVICIFKIKELSLKLTFLENQPSWTYRIVQESLPLADLFWFKTLLNIGTTSYQQQNVHFSGKAGVRLYWHCTLCVCVCVCIHMCVCMYLSLHQNCYLPKMWVVISTANFPLWACLDCCGCPINLQLWDQEGFVSLMLNEFGRPFYCLRPCFLPLICLGSPDFSEIDRQICSS